MINKQRVQRHFDRSAVSYDGVAGMQRDISDQLLHRVNARFLERDNVPACIADLGCGTGYGMRQLRKHFPDAQLVGLDLAPNMLAMARKTLADAVFVHGDMEALPFPSQRFDLVTSSSAVQWCDLQIALAEMLRISKSGGYIALSSFLQGTLSSWRRMWQVSEPRRFLSLGEFALAVSSAGLTDVSFEQKTIKQCFDSFNTAVNSIRDLGAQNGSQNVTQGLMGRQRYQSIRQQAERIIQQEGCITLTYEVMFAVGRKAA